MGPIISKIPITLHISSLVIAAYIDRGDVWNMKRGKKKRTAFEIKKKQHVWLDPYGYFCIHVIVEFWGQLSSLK